MLIDRFVLKTVLKRLNQDKIVVIYGARQVGKTTLVKEVLNKLNMKTLKINADQKKYNDVFSSLDLNKIRSLVGGYKLLFIDEAQRIENIGLCLKIMYDEIQDLKIIVTGSSSFELANKIKESLTGRTYTHILYPLSLLELSKYYNSFELNDNLENLLIYGMYPDIFTTENIFDKSKKLQEMVSSYLYKDILEIERIKYSDKIVDLLRLLAFQVGGEVSITELSNNLNINQETVDKYIYLLEKSFVIFKLKGFSRNLRKEVTKMNKIYFYDLGVRNILIDNLKPLKYRNDVGQLFENFLVAERKKYNNYKEILASAYFWRVHTGAEVDYVEDTGGKIFAYEFKYSKNKVKSPTTFLNTYTDSEFKLINKHNYLDFLM